MHTYQFKNKVDYLILEKPPWPLQAIIMATVLLCIPWYHKPEYQKIKRHMLDTVLHYARIYYILAM